VGSSPSGVVAQNDRREGEIAFTAAAITRLFKNGLNGPGDIGNPSRWLRHARQSSLSRFCGPNFAHDFKLEVCPEWNGISAEAEGLDELVAYNAELAARLIKFRSVMEFGPVDP